MGVNVLRNDVEAAVAIAALAGGRFVRANVYAGAAVTDQGLIEGRADAVQALIRRLDTPISVWADVDVKHAAPLSPRPIGELAEDAVERGLAAAVIVSGAGTGHPRIRPICRQCERSYPARQSMSAAARQRRRSPRCLRLPTVRLSARRRRSTASSAIRSIRTAYEHSSRLLGRSAAGKARRAPLRERRQTFFVVIRVVERGS